MGTKNNGLRESTSDATGETALHTWARKVSETESAYQLREPQASYSDYFAPEKEALRAENTYLEHLSKYINAIAWPDPVYTGKAMAGLIDLINKGHFTKKGTVLFIHTGGVAADFAYSEELSRL